MKKTFLIFPCLLFYLQSHGQSITFDKLYNLLKEKDVKAYVTSKQLGFIKDNEAYPIDRYIKNPNTSNEELIGYDKKPMVEYRTSNLIFMNALIKQIKFPLILKDDDRKQAYYQFGDTHLMIMINIDKRKSDAILSMYRK